MVFALRSVLLPLFTPPPKKSSSWLRAGAEHAGVLDALGEIDLVPTSRAVATGHSDVGLVGRLLGSLWGHLRTSVPSLHFRQGFTSLSLHVPICKMEMTLEGPLKCVVLGHSSGQCQSVVTLKLWVTQEVSPLLCLQFPHR